jgi:hypothetical protein
MSDVRPQVRLKDRAHLLCAIYDEILKEISRQKQSPKYFFCLFDAGAAQDNGRKWLCGSSKVQIHISIAGAAFHTEK